MAIGHYLRLGFYDISQSLALIALIVRLKYIFRRSLTIIFRAVSYCVLLASQFPWIVRGNESNHAGSTLRQSMSFGFRVFLQQIAQCVAWVL